MKSAAKKAPGSYRQRAYRQIQAQGDLVSSFVRISETDLHILADRDVEHQARELVLQYRMQLESYIARQPAFLTALLPLPADDLAPPLVRDMLQAGIAAEVGPMAAVAGAVAEYVGRSLLLQGVREVMVENGGDIFLSRKKDCTVAIFAGQSPLSNKVGVLIAGKDMPRANLHLIGDRWSFPQFWRCRFRYRAGFFDAACRCSRHQAGE